MPVEPLTKEYLEITTKIGCPVGCLRYCPQEITTGNYSDKQTTLTLDDFKIALGHIPRKLPLVFSGFSDPFANKETINFIACADKTQHPIGIFTTLQQVSQTDLKELLKYKYFVFCLHLPDGHNAKIQVTEEYKNNVFTVLQNIPNVSFSIMNDTFVTDNRENVTRGLYSHERKWFRYCHKWDNPAFVMLPNGDVCLCCMDFGLQHKLGNLFIENYQDIKRNYHPGYRLCRMCSRARSQPKYIGSRIIRLLTQG